MGAATFPIPLLENFLKGSNSLQLKRRALFLLAQNDRPAAHQILVNYAKGSGNPDLQIEAIRYLSARKQQTTAADLPQLLIGHRRTARSGPRGP